MLKDTREEQNNSIKSYMPINVKLISVRKANHTYLTVQRNYTVKGKGT